MINKKRGDSCAPRPSNAVAGAALILALALPGLIGCANQRQISTQTPLAYSPDLTESGDSNETYSLNHPGMVLASDEMLALLSKRQEDVGDDDLEWALRRNDGRMGNRPVFWDPYAFTTVEVTQNEYLRDSNGRPRWTGWQRVRSLRSNRRR